MSTSNPSLPVREARPTPAVTRTPIAVAAGDGIGPEILAATRTILDAAGAPLEYHDLVVGEQAYLQGLTSGVPDAAWGVLRRTGVLLKGPITTPKGSGWKSVNVTLRKTLGLFANVRPCVSYAPFVPGVPGMDVVVVRENEEDLYAGIEHRQTQEVVQCLKIVSRTGCERIARYAFAYARAHGRKKVTSVAKDNIMKLTDGLFARTCAEVAKEYPELAYEHQIVDIGTARVAVRPKDYDVIVTMNLYGDIVSDVAAEVAGSIGLAPSANIGAKAAMFEAIHGSAPDIAGKDIANPSGLLLSAVQMLVHLGHTDVAARIQNAWLRT
ncbi:MAG: NADP-dependent isocitrate dehydrogenase, partial [Planctomycetota bacterium]